MKKTVAVIGSRGAIGNAVVDTLLADESVEAVFKFSRAEITEHDDKVQHIFIEIDGIFIGRGCSQVRMKI